MRANRVLPIAVLAALLVACGGGGGDGGGGTPPIGGGSDFTPGIFAASTSFEARCAAPRAGNDPAGRPWPDRLGSVRDEKNWLRSWTHELYLWYREVPDRDPAAFSLPDYFDQLKTPLATTSGQPKDRFHFAIPTDDWLQQSQFGSAAGYGLQWAVLSETPPRELRIAYIEPGPTSPAAAVGLGRGARVLAIDGIDLVNTNVGTEIDRLNDALFPFAAGVSHSFTVQDAAGGPQRAVSMTSANVTSTPVQNTRTIATASGPVGYLLFNDHIATSEAGLVAAITTLRDAGVVDLVLDLRYNGGGFLDIASELAYMIAGNARTSGRTFELLQFNDQHTTRDPVTGEALTPLPFHSMAEGFSVAQGTPLPALGLGRVFVLTGGGTCSASESIINSLRGIDVEVIQVGSTTCGKPYGFYPTDNCGTTWFSIQFRGVNARQFGDYPDGFSPANTVGPAGVLLPGCSVADDFTHALGDASESRLAVALNYRATGGQCGVAPSGVAPDGATGKAALPFAEPVVRKSPWLENRILRR
ncbi:MAG: S41 family peptidase [Steroidobacteraceae bacterium]